MTTFQTLVCLLFGTLAVLSLGAALRGTAPKRVVAAALALWTLGVIAAVWPWTVSGAAHALGIGRGTDLILYLTTLSLAVACVYMYVRFRRVERQLTLLVRRLAMQAAAQRSPGMRASLPSMAPGAPGALGAPNGPGAPGPSDPGLSDRQSRADSGSAPRLLT